MRFITKLNDLTFVEFIYRNALAILNFWQYIGTQIYLSIAFGFICQYLIEDLSVLSNYNDALVKF